MNSLGELLKNLRGKRSLRNVADVTELSHTYISDIEKGFRRGTNKPIHPSPDTLKRLAEAYDYPYEELMKVAGYIEEEIIYSADEEKERVMTFSKRLKNYLGDDAIAIQKAADYCGVTAEYISKMITNPASLPGVRTLYKLAELLNITPDYLGGFTDDPSGHDSRTPRPKDMQEFLAKEEVMLYGEVLDDDDKEKLNNILAAVFLDAKKKNKRR